MSLTVAALSCGPRRGSTPDATPSSPGSRPFDIELAGANDRLDPALLGRIRAGPAGYFRFINVTFTNEVCRRFQPLASSAEVTLHGDPHLQQYAITEAGRGLTDFDSAASGPAVLDLLRFGTSLVLACTERGWHEIDPVLHGFFHGYRSALRDPATVAPEPSIVARVRSGFHFDPVRYFGWLDSISEPVSAASRLLITSALEPYVDAMIAQDPGLTREYFRVEAVGRSRMGIGSARSRKYVVRVRGPSDALADDEVLELKQVEPVSGVACLSPSSVIDPMRPIVAHEHIVYEPYRLVGYVVLDRSYFWVHAWARSYHELSVHDLRGASELLEVAFDVGVQLGLGHPRRAAAPHDVELRQAGVRLLDEHEGELEQLSKTLAGEVIDAWSRFSRRSETGAMTRP